MEINRALPSFGREVADEALRQITEYTNAPPIHFSVRTSCCDALRQNPDLVDPGYYLNGGPSCQQMGLSCGDPHEHEVIALADGLVPGSFVYAPVDERRFWPAMVDFSPEGESHFVIFRYGGPQCCTPYAYYVSFVPGRARERFGGWFTVDNIVPFDTMVQRDVDLDHNHNDPEFDCAYQRTNRYYSKTLVERLARVSHTYSVMLRELNTEKKRSFGGEIAKQARKLSRGLLHGFTPNIYTRVASSESGNTAGPSGTASAGRLAHLLKKKTPPTADSGKPTATIRGEHGFFGTVSLTHLIHEENHTHDKPTAASLQQAKAEMREGPSRRLILNNPTDHAKTATHIISQRTAICAIMRIGLHKIRIYQSNSHI